MYVTTKMTRVKKEIKKEIDVKFLERETANVSFSEVYSNTNVTEFCMLDDNYKAIHPQIRCKDYIQDLFWIITNKKNLKCNPSYVYGFTPANYIDKYPLKNRDIYRVGIRFRTKEQEFRPFNEEQRDLIRTVLNKLETILEFPTSNVFISNQSKIMVFEFHPEWTKYLYLISLYLLIIRALSIEKIEVLKTLKEEQDITKYLLDYPSTHSGNDAKNLKSANFLLQRLFNKDFPEQTWDYDNLHAVHNTTGIASYSLLLDQINKKQIEKKDEATIS